MAAVPTVSARLKQASLAGRTITLKLKTADFRVRTRSRHLADPTQLADTLFRTAAALLSGEADGVTRSRLIGVGTAALVEDLAANPPTLFNREFDRLRRLEYSMNSNSHQARRSIRTTRPRPAGHQQDPYDISAQGMKMTG